MPALIFVMVLMAVFQQNVFAISYSSGPGQTQQIELFTSEGCSSCPPAEQWLNKIKDSSKLFKTEFPMAFHVDYWDDRGWKDPFSQAQFTERQRHYARLAHAKQVYTPCFMINGREWRGFFTDNKSMPEPTKYSGTLQVTITPTEDSTLKISGQFTPTDKLPEDEYHLHLAILGLGIKHSVKAGENHGKTLSQDFVVLHHEAWDERWLKPNQDKQTISWQGVIHEIPQLGQKEMAITAWIEKSNDPTPIQTTGGWL